MARSSERASKSTRPPTGPPPHWPAAVPYLTHPVPHPLLPAALRTRYCSPLPPPSPPPHLALRPILSPPTHPALGQHGLFNGPKRIERGAWIRDYCGVVHGEEGKDDTSDYDLSLDSESGIGCDAAKRGNEARFVNDYRGILPRPNALFDLREAPVPNSRAGETGIVMAIWAGPKGVEKGVEICVSYGKGFWKHRVGEEAEEKNDEDELGVDAKREGDHTLPDNDKLTPS